MKRAENPTKLQAFEKQLQVVNEQLSGFQVQFSEKMLTLDKKYQSALKENATLKESLHKERSDRKDILEELLKLKSEHELLKTRMQRDVHAANIPQKDKEINSLKAKLSASEELNQFLNLMCGATLEKNVLLTEQMCIERNWNINQYTRERARIFRMDHEEFSFRFALCQSSDQEYDIAFLPIQLSRRTGMQTEILVRLPSGAPEYIYYRVDVTRAQLKYLISGMNVWFSQFVTERHSQTAKK
uniref:Uncharacterized protein n=1 Tax=Percolomonas cosmopolitus TaxID=63605 RepID=A0A7S1KR44_9EUKA|mmetsp:Transcript_5335/g.19940  ORF Transcript_5335/g.19940 Transcript_5335/m.19940 type:complete len:243 (+) Transcript_5335:146-874(+)